MTYCQLTERERYQIEFLLARGKRPAAIAKEIKRHRSTIIREIKRNSLETICGSCYDATPAHGLAKDRRREACEARYKLKGRVRKYFESRLKRRWSPEQIAGRLNLEQGEKLISKSSIYRAIAKDREDYLGQRYYQKLRRFKVKRNRRSVRPSYESRGCRRSIRERSEECDSRQVVGHVERDLMEGVRGKKAVLVVADRKTRRVRLALVMRNAASVQNAMQRIVKHESLKSITNDNGWEFKPASIPIAEKKLRTKIYYCDPRSPWQRGTVENAIGLLRQYFPKRSDFTNLSQRKLKRVEDLLNDRPRKILNFKTPSEIYFEQLKKTGS